MGMSVDGRTCHPELMGCGADQYKVFIPTGVRMSAR